MSDFIRGMDQLYFQISPEQALDAQRDFQGLVYTTAFSLAKILSIWWEFYKQFIENAGIPMRMAPSAMHQQLRIALTAQCDIFNPTFREFDTEVLKLREVCFHISCAPIRVYFVLCLTHLWPCTCAQPCFAEP
jgi:hypothetical protein